MDPKRLYELQQQLNATDSAISDAVMRAEELFKALHSIEFQVQTPLCGDEKAMVWVERGERPRTRRIGAVINDESKPFDQWDRVARAHIARAVPLLFERLEEILGGVIEEREETYSTLSRFLDHVAAQIPTPKEE